MRWGGTANVLQKLPYAGFRRAAAAEPWATSLAGRIRKIARSATDGSNRTNRAAHPDYVQGVNSFASALQGYDPQRNSCYGGMTPPDCPHTYELHVYALDTKLELEAGFYMNELYWKMQGHILAQATLSGVYEN